MPDLKGMAIRGGIAKAIAQVANLGLRVGSLVVLARLLDPKDFGLVAMVTAVSGLLNVFKDFGLSAATVQRSTVSEDQVSTLFWINLLLGALLTCVLLASAPILAQFYQEPRLLMVTAALSGAFLLNAAGIQHTARLQREMRFVSLAVIDIVSLIASVSIGIGMAFWGLGYWALVGMTLTTPLTYSTLVWLVTAWIPGAPRRNAGVLSMMRFGGTVTLNSVVVYVAYNLEKVLLGRFWGAESLGIYGRAYQLINISTDSLNSAAGDVAFSGLSRVKDDPTRLRSYFLKGYSLVIASTLPITITCALLADDLILVVLGPKWSETIPVFRLLAPTTLIFAMINPMVWLMFALGLVERSLKIALVLAPLVVTGYLIGLPYGPRGVALGFSAVMTLWVIPHIAWCVHGTVVSLGDVLRACGRPLISALVAAAVAGVVMSFVPESLSHFVRLVSGVFIVIVTYVGMLFYAMGQKAFYVDLVRSLRKPAPPAKDADSSSST